MHPSNAFLLSGRLGDLTPEKDPTTGLPVLSNQDVSDLLYQIISFAGLSLPYTARSGADILAVHLLGVEYLTQEEFRKLEAADNYLKRLQDLGYTLLLELKYTPDSIKDTREVWLAAVKPEDVAGVLASAKNPAAVLPPLPIPSPPAVPEPLSPAGGGGLIPGAPPPPTPGGTPPPKATEQPIKVFQQVSPDADKTPKAVPAEKSMVPWVVGGAVLLGAIIIASGKSEPRQ